MRIIFLGLLLLLGSIFCSAAGAQFVHPGVAHSSEDIALAKEKLAAKEEPWLSSWKLLVGSTHASLQYKPNAFSEVERGSYNDPDIGSSEFSSDGRAAYCHAVCWAITGDEAHAKKTEEILNAWSGELESIKNHDAALLIGMGGYHYCVAAELLKHTWDKWSAKDQARFETMLREIYYPVIKDFYPTANGNWDASMLQVMIAMGVFLDDQKMFDKAKDYYLQGSGNGAIGNYFKPSGQCQESGRDQSHTQMGLEFLANTCETAWIQGVDLYGALDNRLLKGFEYTAKFNLGMDVPYEPYESVEGRHHYKKISNSARGISRPMYERVHNHYANRKGLETRYTEQAALKLREESPEARERNDGRRSRKNRSRTRNRSSASALDTLLYAGVPAAGKKDAVPVGGEAK